MSKSIVVELRPVIWTVVSVISLGEPVVLINSGSGTQTVGIEVVGVIVGECDSSVGTGAIVTQIGSQGTLDFYTRARVRLKLDEKLVRQKQTISHLKIVGIDIVHITARGVAFITLIN
jgi:hypothetical protein